MNLARGTGISSSLALTALLTLAVTPQTARAQTSCSVPEKNATVRDILQEYYFWYRELPDLSPAAYDSPEAYLEAVRFKPIDTSYSYVTDRAANEAFYSASQFIGIGFGSKQTSPSQMRVTQVFPDSPAAEAGLVRGDELLTIGGESVSELLTQGGLNAALGPNEEGYRLQIGWVTRDGEERRATVVKRPVTIPTVSQSSIFEVAGLPVGYLHFRNFVEPSTDALNATFARFEERGVTDIILDLRYNGGGLVDVARHLGSLIGGVRTNTRVFVQFLHNDKQTARNREDRFFDPVHAVDVPRLVVITSRSSASSSELVINGLKPFMPVTLVGQATFGKPVGQYGFDFCDKTLAPVSFELQNALGEGKFFDGIPVDCPAIDDLDRPLAHRKEGMLAEALYFLEHGSCSPESRAASQAKALRAPFGLERYGFDQLVNAW